MDKLCSKLIEDQSAIVFIGAASINNSSPIKKHKRCPGTRRLMTALTKKPGVNCVFVDEYFTSQKCGRCFEPFPEGTRLHRFKICRPCVPLEEALPADRIWSDVGKKKLRRQKQENHQQQASPMVRKKTRYIKNTDLLPAGENRTQTIWHRDITAAKLILYKGSEMNCILIVDRNKCTSEL